MIYDKNHVSCQQKKMGNERYKGRIMGNLKHYGNPKTLSLDCIDPYPGTLLHVDKSNVI